MRKKFTYIFFVTMAIFLLAACGNKTEEQVVDELKEKMEQMNGYKLKGTMTLSMGQDTQKYEVEVWHSKPDFYRVHLKNTENDQSQMILRNKEGVFVLTPALNKSFKFQSEWPTNTSQPYLYESLITDILEDKETEYLENDKHYVFETKTRYQYHKMLPLQEITFNKSNLAPASVKIMDQDRNVMLAVEFSEMEFDTPFEEGAFDLNRNMTGAQLEVPVATNESERPVSMPLKIPMAELPGATLTDEEEVLSANGTRYVMTYEGEKGFTFIQEKEEAVPTSLTSTPINGDPVHIGATIGAITDRSLTWVEDGIKYMIASNNLTREEMIMLAESLEVVSEK